MVECAYGGCDACYDGCQMPIEDDEEDYEVECARCGKKLRYGEAYIEEGDEWECEPCNIRCEAIEYYENRGLDIYINPETGLERAEGGLFITLVAAKAIERHLSKG